MQNEEHPLLGYDFEFLGGLDNSYYFITKNEIVYEVKFKTSGYVFDKLPAIQSHTFEFIIEVIENPKGTAVPFDNMMRNTVAAIILDFFNHDKTVVIYVCDTSDARGMARFRKFNSWFSTHPAAAKFSKHDIGLMEVNETPFFASIITRIDNPLGRQVVWQFLELATQYNQPK